MPLGSDHCRALEMLAESKDGCLDHVLHLFGFSEEVISDLIRTGLATAEPKLSFPERNPVRRIRITDAGKVALERP